MKRKMLQSLALICFLSVIKLNAQTVEIFTNPNTSQNIVTGNMNYHVGEVIYENAELGNASFTSAFSPINHIEVSVNAVGASGAFGNFNIYFKDIPASTTTFSPGVYDKTGYTQVYAGSLNITDTGWYSINLNTAFIRTPGMGLQVMFERLDGVNHITSMFNYNASLGNSTSTSAPSARRYNGSAAPVIGSTSLSLSAFRPAIRFTNLSFPALFYRTRQTGNWNNAATWETSPAADFSWGILSPAATNPNASNSNGAVVRAGHTVTVTANVTSRPVTVNTSGQLLVNGGVVFGVTP